MGRCRTWEVPTFSPNIPGCAINPGAASCFLVTSHSACSSSWRPAGRSHRELGHWAPALQSPCPLKAHLPPAEVSHFSFGNQIPNTRPSLPAGNSFWRAGQRSHWVRREEEREVEEVAFVLGWPWRFSETEALAAAQRSPCAQNECLHRAASWPGSSSSQPRAVCSLSTEAEALAGGLMMVSVT